MQDVASLLQISYCSQSTIPHNTLGSWCNCHKYIITDNITENPSQESIGGWPQTVLQEICNWISFLPLVMTSWAASISTDMMKSGKRNSHLYMCCTLNTCKLCIWWIALLIVSFHSLSLLPVMFSNGEQVVFLQAASSCLFNSVFLLSLLFLPLGFALILFMLLLLLWWSWSFAMWSRNCSEKLALYGVHDVLFSCHCFCFGDLEAFWWCWAKNCSGKACSLWCSWCVVFMLLLLLSWS